MGLNPLKFGGRIQAIKTASGITNQSLNPLKFGGRIQAEAKMTDEDRERVLIP